jgi:hypothetical protein
MSDDTIKSDEIIRVKEAPQSYNVKMMKRLSTVRVALRLGATYEYTKVTAKAATLCEDTPIIAHTWADRSVTDVVYKGDRPLVRDYPLAQDARSAVLSLPLGVSVILGKSGSGKTRLVFDHLFVTAERSGQKPMYFQVFEPADEDKVLANAERDNLVIPEFEIDFAASFAQALFDPTRELIIIDSMRYLFYASSGGVTGKGGVNMTLFMDITHLDKLARQLGKRVILVVNPMSDDDTAFDYYIEAANGAAAAVFVVDTSTSARFTSRFGGAREFQGIAIPRRTAIDAFKPKAKDQALALGARKTTDPSVSASIFGTNNKR